MMMLMFHIFHHQKNNMYIKIKREVYMNHIGRPTNKEIKKRKRKKILKIGLPITLVIIF